MLPDFLSTKERISEMLIQHFEGQVDKHSGGFISRIPKRKIHEGDSLRTIYGDGSKHEAPLKKMSMSTTVDIQEVITDPLRVFEKIDELAKQAAVQQSDAIFSTMSEVLEGVGNVINTRGRIKSEDILQMFKTIEIDFSNDGKARMPSIVGGEKILGDLAAVLQEIESTPHLKRRFEKIMFDQKEKWVDRENNRKLVG